MPHGRKKHRKNSSSAIRHHPDAATKPDRRCMHPCSRSGDSWNEQTDRRSPTLISSPAKRGVFYCPGSLGKMCVTRSALTQRITPDSLTWVAPRCLAASKKIENLLHSTHRSLIELRETTPGAGDSVVALIAYIKEAAPKSTRDTNLTSLVGSTATLTTHVARRFTAVSSHVPLEFGFL